MMKRAFFLALALVGAAACSSEPEPVERIDTASICLSGDSEPDDDGLYAIAEGSRVVVTAQVCQACGAENDLLSCAVEQNGGTLTVRTTYMYDDVSDEQQACTADCRFVEAECQSEPLAEGLYTVVYAGWQADLDVDVPSSMPETCSN
jgi:hypothetical protein